MSFSTSVPQPTLGVAGFVAPTDQAILTGVQADYSLAFGSNINPALNTPQGQLETSTTAVISDSYSQFIDLSNQFDPAYNDGRYQDAIGRIYFLTRIPGEPTTLQVVCGGYPGVVIPLGAQVQDPNQNIYAAILPGTIGPGGSVTLGFANLVLGPAPVPETVTIYQTVPQWNTVTVASGAEGQNVETRAEFEARRQATVGANGQGFLDSISGAILQNCAGVISLYATENFTGSTLSTGGISLVPHSLYVAVYGGNTQEIAEQIWIKKDPGCNYNGNTTVEVQDLNPEYSAPFPTYYVTLEVPAGVATCVNVTIENNPGVPSNAASLVQQAVLSGFTGADGGSRAGIGKTQLASRYYPDVLSLGTWALIESIQIGTNATPDCAFTATIATSATMDVTSISSGTLAPGDFVFGQGVASGQIILVQTSGTTGSTGNYTVSVGQTITSESMSCVSADENIVTLNINLMPTLAAADINLILA